MSRARQVNKNDGPKAGLRSLHVLMELARSRSSMSMGEMAQEFDLPRASLHRLLRSLEADGFLLNSAGRYVLGPKSIELARLIEQLNHNEEFPGCARPVLERLAEKTSETVILGRLSEERTEIIYADVVVADSPLRYAVPAGDRRPLYSSASGKAVLSFLSIEEISRYIENTEFTPLTPLTTTKQQLPGFLDKARKTGLVIESGGHHLGAKAIASPVFNDRGKVFAAIAVAGLAERMELIEVDIPHLVHEAGETISRILGFKDPYPSIRTPYSEEPSDVLAK